MDDNSELLGEVTKINCDENLKIVEVEELMKPFKWSKAVCRCFCQSCGTLKEINAKSSTTLMTLLEPPITKDLKELKNFYFTVNYCNCLEAAELKIRLVKIPTV